MNSDEIAKVFSQFFRSTEELSSFLSLVTTLADIRKADFKLEAINARRNAALIPFENERIDLTNQRNELVATLNKIIG